MNKKTYFHIGIVIVLIFIFISIFAPLIAPHNPYYMYEPFIKPNKTHILGTNDVGNDIFSELIFGARNSLTIGLAAALIITFIGTFLGMLSGYLGGWIDNIVLAITNIASAIPTLPLAVLLIAFLSPGKKTLIISMIITSWTSTTRVVRMKTRELSELPFIKIEQSLGLSNFLVLFKHILPNLYNIVFIRGTMTIATCMMMETSLSFLGLGVFGEKSWGSILRYAFFRNSILKGQYWWYLPPIVCISLTVLGFMLIGHYGDSNE